MKKKINELMKKENNKLNTVVAIMFIAIACFMSSFICYFALDSESMNYNKTVLSDFIRWESQKFYLDKSAETEYIICDSETTEEMLDRYVTWKLGNYNISAEHVCTTSTTYPELLLVTYYSRFVEDNTDLNSRIKKVILDSIYSDMLQKFVCQEESCVSAIDRMHNTYISLCEKIDYNYKGIFPVEKVRSILPYVSMCSLIVAVVCILFYNYVCRLTEDLLNILEGSIRKQSKVNENKESSQ